MFLWRFLMDRDEKLRPIDQSIFALLEGLALAAAFAAVENLKPPSGSIQFSIVAGIMSGVLSWGGFQWRARKTKVKPLPVVANPKAGLEYVMITGGGAFTQSLSESLAVEIKNTAILTCRTSATVRLESDRGVFITASPAHWRVQKRTDAGNMWTGVRTETDVIHGTSQLLMIVFKRKNGPWQVFGGIGEDTLCGTLGPGNWKATITAKAEGSDDGYLRKEIHFAVTEDNRLVNVGL